MHEGHRKRMLERLAQGGENLQEHELLEILLFNAIPRKNTNEIAHNLLNAFGNIDGVFGAEFSQLSEIEGVGESTAAYLKCIALFYEKVKFGKKELPALVNAGDFASLVKARFEGLSCEVLDFYCTDSRNRVKRFQRFSSKETDRVRLAPEQVSKFIAKEHPYGLVAAHNHLSGGCDPSEEDDNFTAQIQMLCSMNNIRFLDHCIVCGDGFYSYFMSGRMEDIRRHFSVENIFGKKKP